MTAVDSSVIIAGLLSWHEFHDRALHALGKLISARRLLVPFPALIESYSVMTRLPSPHRLDPGIAYQLLHESFSESRVIGLSAGSAWTFLGEYVAAGISGGRVYDAVIASAAIAAHASELLTFNQRDFEAFSDRIAIIVP
ncbi:MAG TPA: PIN domain-containing protein [Thermoanaerobaculia bacterium]|jgi:predicted nucleic acid-binding protein|nr:PIN domain-containing protein [Thermoanaerobaculia bacterium]